MTAAETYAQPRSGDLEIEYVRYDERTDRFYVTLKPWKPLLPDLPRVLSATDAALAANIRWR